MIFLRYICFQTTGNDGTGEDAGSWQKMCAEKTEFLTEMFGEDLSDGCVEQKEYIKVCNIEACFLS